MKKEFWFFTLLCTVTVFMGILFHESMHFIFGRLMGIPANFLSLTSVGVPKDYDLSIHSETAVFLMNVPAVWISVLVGVIALVILIKDKNLLRNSLGIFLAWIAIDNVPYLALQLLTVGTETSAKGEGIDFAYMASVLNFSDPLIFFCLILSLVLMPTSYYLLSLMFEKKEASLNFQDLNIYRKTIAFVFLVIPLGYFLFSIFKFSVNQEIVISIENGLFFFTIPLIVAMLVLINYRDEESADLFKKFFFPGLFLGVVLFTLWLLWLIPFVKPILESIIRMLNDSLILIITLFPQLVGMVFFFQLRTPNKKII